MAILKSHRSNYDVVQISHLMMSVPNDEMGYGALHHNYESSRWPLRSQNGGGHRHGIRLVLCAACNCSSVFSVRDIMKTKVLVCNLLSTVPSNFNSVVGQRRVQRKCKITERGAIVVGSQLHV